MVKENLETILRKVADAEGFTNYEIDLHENSLKGDGFLSECYTAEIINKDTESKIAPFIKASNRFMGDFSDLAFSNEYHFYSQILPELNKFQISKDVKNPLQNFPKFYLGNAQGDDEYLVFENLQTQNFVLTDKSQNLSKDHLRLIFETYGKFHALTFAFKEQNSKQYLELIQPIKDLFVGNEGARFVGATKAIFSAACDIIKEDNIDISGKLESILGTIDESFVNSIKYTGKYSALTHGDGWSNNMLFKYGENGKIEDIKILDLQFCRDSTPIHDLSYFFYSGAAKEDFDKLDEYLLLYHESFSAFAKELGSDSHKLLPLDTLKSEWKKYGLMGILMGVLLWQTKLVNRENIEKFTSSGDSGEPDDSFFVVALQSDTFKINATNILRHAVEYGII